MSGKPSGFFDEDASQFACTPIDDHIIGTACMLLNQYGTDGLRSLDSIQLATALALKTKRTCL
ncbi:hypothetical protein GCM10010967_46230 [Dyadobacter beijingensis]|uniref:Uncharacterized protein n=1 Tax=Dyadobacter beijingensis TaxID=365489 RepID=A0ABQ2IDZ6_9BACT|nr:hypothetical protein GCM10010967_46230 [Dyadobacter beijingensis]